MKSNLVVGILILGILLWVGSQAGVAGILITAIGAGVVVVVRVSREARQAQYRSGYVSQDHYARHARRS